MLLGSGDASSPVGGLVVRERDELPREQSPFVSVQVERAALDRLDPHLAGVEQIEELLELVRASVEPIQMPHDHRRRRNRDPLQQLLVAGAGSFSVGGDRFVDELDGADVAEAGGEGGAIVALLLYGRVLAGAVGGDS